MSDERRLEVLRAIVQDYVATSEPVGSKALLERHALGVSAATVRNDMAVLEEQGLISAPHTSAGRIPTDAGYRLFVDQIHQLKPLSRSERTAIRTFLEEAVDLDDVVDRTVRLLSSLTHQVAVMQYPSINAATVRHLELVSLSPDRLTLVMILSTGRVDQRVLRLEHEADALHDAKRHLNEQAVGRTQAAAAESLASWVSAHEQVADATTVRVLAAVALVLAEEREERVALAGTAHLARSGADFPIGPVLDALEEHVVLLRLLGEMTAEDRETVAVRIGGENTVEGLRTASVISTTYSAGSAGGLGVLGPTRMDYPTTMAAVRAVARYVSQILDQ
ncbi:heat-inducible transcriptional repressor HrcA [Calidifontibacter sp. DB0510]|uniref:Heat-inducible transcription repressor HrcA n=1 Tax=Metallococcus carri TaxID=1656884 RepID=A0A967ECY9_9MICO|nr:heat-inducible transcriptional repressor HrcA [Metallococcus carri]NHN54196.1 heat-inducible transcriptional repressor HrcA [Metallococcus carri]NOP36964.1 heat-inducible transcriptional repressor HrcA [Calidifontibacter sp. DB2511S]